MALTTAPLWLFTVSAFPGTFSSDPAPPHTLFPSLNPPPPPGQGQGAEAALCPCLRVPCIGRSSLEVCDMEVTRPNPSRRKMASGGARLLVRGPTARWQRARVSDPWAELAPRCWCQGRAQARAHLRPWGLLEPQIPAASLSRMLGPQLCSGRNPPPAKGSLGFGYKVEPLIHVWWEPPAAQSEEWRTSGEVGRGSPWPQVRALGPSQIGKWALPWPLPAPRAAPTCSQYPCPYTPAPAEAEAQGSLFSWFHSKNYCAPTVCQA